MTNPEDELYLDRQTYIDIKWDKSKWCNCAKCWNTYLRATGEWSGHHKEEDVTFITDRFFRIKSKSFL